MHFSFASLFIQAHCQCGLEERDSVQFVEIWGVSKTGRPFLDYFVFQKNTYFQFIDSCNTFRNATDVINYCGNNGTLVFPFSENTFFLDKTCYNFKSKSEQLSLFDSVALRFRALLKDLKKRQTTLSERLQSNGDL